MELPTHAPLCFLQLPFSLSIIRHYRSPALWQKPFCCSNTVVTECDPRARRPVGRSGLVHGRGGRDGGPLLKKDCPVAAIHYRNGSDSFQPRLGRVIGGRQGRVADRGYASLCGHSSRGASGLGATFVGALCWRIDSPGVDPRSVIGSPGKGADLGPRAVRWPSV
jgi:hypothetical protein